MTTAAVMQPTYLPWLGYLDLMDQVDTFVLLDTVQFDYRSWQHRNRIPGPQEPTWLTVPVTKDTRRAPIAEVRVAQGGEFPARHANLLADRYRAGADEPRDELVQRLAALATADLLTEVTIPLVEWLAQRFSITTPIVAASALAGTGERSERLASLTEAVGADRYVSPPGSLAYLADDHDAFDRRGLEIVVHTYDHPAYDQGDLAFQSHCSAVDLLLRRPEDAAVVLRSGRRAPLPLTAGTAA